MAKDVGALPVVLFFDKRVGLLEEVKSELVLLSGPIAVSLISDVLMELLVE